MQSHQSPESSSKPTLFWDLCEGDSLLFRLDNSDDKRSKRVPDKFNNELIPAFGSSGLMSCIVIYMNVSDKYAFCAHVAGISDPRRVELKGLNETEWNKRREIFREKFRRKLDEEIFNKTGM